MPLLVKINLKMLHLHNTDLTDILYCIRTVYQLGQLKEIFVQQLAQNISQ
jgi:hypothetical protein